MLLYQLLAYIIHGMYYKLTPTWSGKFELPHASYSVSDIQNFLEYIFIKTWRKDLTFINNIHK